MSSIADQLGSLLPEGWSDEAEESPAAEVEVTEVDVQEAGATPEEIVIAVILEETGFDPALMRPELRLVEDLDLTGLALWSVVAQVEHELKATFPDVDVEGWVTLGDVLQAVRAS